MKEVAEMRGKQMDFVIGFYILVSPATTEVDSRRILVRLLRLACKVKLHHPTIEKYH